MFQGNALQKAPTEMYLCFWRGDIYSYRTSAARPWNTVRVLHGGLASRWQKRTEQPPANSDKVLWLYSTSWFEKLPTEDLTYKDNSSRL